MVWYSHLLKNFPQFIVIYTVKGFGIVNKTEIDVFLELSCFFHDPAYVGNLISGSPEARGGGQENQSHFQGAVAAWVQEGLEELSHVEGQEGRQ